MDDDKILACSKPVAFDGGIYSNDTVAYFKWALTPGTSTKVVLTIVSSDSSFKKIINTSDASAIVSLPRCKKISAYLQAQCDNTLSEAVAVSFETKGCGIATPCSHPVNLVTKDIFADSIRLSWAYDIATKFYVSYYALPIDGTLPPVAILLDSSSTTNITLKHLIACTYYQASVYAVCNGVRSEPATIKFKTAGCTTTVCPKPTTFKVAGTDGSAILSWQVPSGDSVIITIAATDTAFKKAITVGGSTYTLSGLPRCKHFIAYIQTKCSNNTVSDYLDGVNFETSGCVASTCSAVQQVGAAVSDANNTVVIKWAGNAPKYYVEYRIATDSTSGVWKRDSTKESFLTLTGLHPCQSFVARVIAVCATGVTAPSPLTYFKTEGCAATTCHRPIAFKGAAQDTIAYFGWATELNENNAVLTVVSTDSTYKKTIAVTGTNYTLTGLPRCKKFVAHIQTKCPTGVLSDALELVFTTGGCTTSCGTPAEIGVVSADSTHAFLKWTNVGATKYYVEYKTDSSAVWKRDSTTATTITLKDLIKCRLYLARVSAVCANGVSEASNIVHFTTSGCVVTPICKIPEGLDADVAHDTTVNFMWTGVNPGNYEIQYRIATDANAAWTIIKASHPNYFLTGLKRCQVYEWQVRQICSTATAPAAWSAPDKFATSGCGTGVASAVCPKIQEIGVKLIADTVVVYWASFSPRPFMNYQVQYRKTTDTDWSASINSVLPYYIFKNLTACINYVVRVRVACDSAGMNFGDWSDVRFKQGGTNCLRGDNSGFVNNTSDIQAAVSPNPGSENPTVVFKLEQQSPVRIDVLNINGSLVGQWNAGTLQTGEYSHTFEQLDILPTGLYIVALRIDGLATKTIKWMKE